MRLLAEIATNPGHAILFVAEIRLEKSERVTMPWWGLWVGWWVHRPPRWREMLWAWERVVEGDWRTWMVRLLGFEINWQRRTTKHGWAG